MHNNAARTFDYKGGFSPSEAKCTFYAILVNDHTEELCFLFIHSGSERAFERVEEFYLAVKKDFSNLFGGSSYE